VTQDVQGNPLFAAIISTAFAYEGWIVATSINSELRDAKKNLPRALTIGSILIVAVYILYYIGLAGAAPNAVMMENGEQGALIAFGKIFGFFGGFLFVFVIISCLGTLNGLMMGAARGIYALAVRGRGPKPGIFSQVDKTTDMSGNSGVLGLFLCALWLFFFYGANLTDSLFGPFGFDSSELPIVALYVFYIPIFIKFMQKEKELSFYKRAILPGTAVLCCLFMMVATYLSHGQAILWFLLVFAAAMVIGAAFGIFRAPDKENI
jgi:APA family basic amino acid/polyamine antiporter